MTGTTERWQRLSPRERAAVLVALVVVAGGLGYAVLWQPLVHDLERTEQAIAQVTTELATVRLRIDEIASLAKSARAPQTPNALGAVRHVVAAHEDASTSTIDMQDGGVRLTLASVALPALVRILDQLGREEQLFPVEMSLTRRVEPGRIRADVTLAR